MYFRCSQCGYENGPDYRFCGMCGAPLPSSQPAAAQVPPLPRPSESKPAPARGQSVLGLAEEPRRSVDYLLEDEEEPHSSHWRLYLALAILIVAGTLIWARWRQYGYPWAAPPTAATTQNQAATVEAGPAVDSSGSPSAPSPSSSASSPATEREAPVQDHTAEPAPVAPASPPAMQPTQVAEHPPFATPSPPAATPVPAAAQGSEAANSAPKREVGAPASTPPAAPKEQPKLAPAASSSTGDSLVVEGEKYLYGNGVPQDCDRATRTLTRAASRSNSKAQTLLGAMFATGHCAARDLPTAYRWFAKALHNDPTNVRLERDLQMVWSQMTPGERQLATRSE